MGLIIKGEKGFYMLSGLSGNWFINELEGNVSLADCKKMGLKQSEVAFSIINYYVTHLLDSQNCDYRIITDIPSRYEVTGEKEKIISREGANEFFEKLSNGIISEPTEKMLFIFIEELNSLNSFTQKEENNFTSLLRSAKRRNIRFIIISDGEERSSLLNSVMAVCDSLFIHDKKIKSGKIFLVSKLVYTLKFVLGQKSISVSDIQRELRIGYVRASDYVKEFESHGIVKRFKRKRGYKVLTHNLRRAFDKLKKQPDRPLYVFGEEKMDF